MCSHTHTLTFGDSWSNIELTLSIWCQIFFRKANHFENFFLKLYWIESTTYKFIVKPIHFNNLPIIYRFSTIYLLNIEIAEADNLTSIDVFSMILKRAITSPKVNTHTHTHTQHDATSHKHTWIITNPRRLHLHCYCFIFPGTLLLGFQKGRKDVNHQ